MKPDDPVTQQQLTYLAESGRKAVGASHLIVVATGQNPNDEDKRTTVMTFDMEDAETRNQMEVAIEQMSMALSSLMHDTPFEVVIRSKKTGKTWKPSESISGRRVSEHEG